MKKKKKWMALFLCLVMCVSLLIACGKKEEDSSSNTQTNTGTQTTDGNQTGTDDKKEETSKEDTQSAQKEAEGDVLTELILPLTDEKKELSAWTLWSNNYVENPNDMAPVQKMEELTNVHINWQGVLMAEASEKFGLLLASGSIPDIVYCFGVVSYPGGNDVAVQDGIFLDTTELVEKYMPNYRTLREQSEDLIRDTMTDSGKIVAIYGMNTSDTGVAREMEWAGLTVRKDMLDQYGLEVPETMEEWHNALTVAKENGATEPLLIGGNGYDFVGSFITAYGILPEFYQENGEVKYGPQQEGYRQWVERMRDWYAEGLIDPNFTTQSSGLAIFTDPVYVTSGRSLAYSTLYGYTGNGFYLSGITDYADINVVGVSNPVLNKGDTSRAIQITSPACGNETFIAASCSDPILAAKWLDFQFSHEGMLLNYYGIEGDTYTVASDGTLQYTEKITNDSEGATPADAKTKYIRGNGIGLYNWESVAHTTANYDICKVAQETWSAQDMSLNLPKQMSMTEEEGNEYNSVYTSIQTLVNEMTVKYIIGAESMDSYENFQSQLEQYGIARCIEIKQAALDRYNNRGK